MWRESKTHAENENSKEKDIKFGIHKRSEHKIDQIIKIVSNNKPQKESDQREKRYKIKIIPKIPIEPLLKYKKDKLIKSTFFSLFNPSCANLILNPNRILLTERTKLMRPNITFLLNLNSK